MGTFALKKTFGPAAIPRDVSTPENARIVREIFSLMTNRFTPFNLEGTSFVFKEHLGADAANGTTGFFRHSAVMHPLINSLHVAARGRTAPIRILAAPSSVGCEAYTLSAVACASGISQMRDFRIDSFDRSETFTALARLGAYPRELSEHLFRKKNGALFSSTENEIVYVRNDVKSNVRFLDPQGIENFVPQERYNAIMLNNLFMYLNEEQQDKVIDFIKDSEADIVIMTSDDNAPVTIPRSLPYVPLKNHPDWQDSSLARADLMSYYIWARSQPGANYAPTVWPSSYYHRSCKPRVRP